MSAERFIDNETYCPSCGRVRTSYVNIPASVRTYDSDDPEEGQVTDHLGPMRDYRCDNCDHEWSMEEVKS